MRRMRLHDLAAFTTTISLATMAVASGGEETNQTGLDLSQMAERLAELEDNNAALQGRVNELEAADGKNWLTKQRAQEIRGVVTDVLADADTRTSLQSSGMTAGWDNGFFLQSPDGRFRLNVGGMVQARWTYSGIRESYSTQTGFNTFTNWQNTDSVGSRKGFDLAHTRLDFNGNIFGQSTRYRIMGEFASTYGRSIMNNANASQGVNASEPEVNAGSYYLLDAWVSHDLTSDFSIRAGQFKLPFDRGWQVPIKYQLIGERDTVSQHLGLGRSQGLELRWSTNDIRIRGAYSDGATDSLLTGYYLVGTRPQNSPWTSQQSNWSVSARAEFKVAGSWADFARMTSLPGDEFSMLFGLGFHAQENKLYLGQQAFSGTPNNHNLWLGFTADATFNFGGASIAASAYYHNIQAKTTVNPNTLSGNPVELSDLGTVNLMGLSVYGSMYMATGFETFLGWEFMDISGGDFASLADSAEPAGANAGGSNVAFRSPHPLNLANIGFNWYIDGEDLKLTVMGTYMIAQVYQGWATPSTGVRGTPVGSSFALRAQLQLLF